MTQIRIGCSSWSYKDWVAKKGNQSYFDLKTKAERKAWAGPFFRRGTKTADLLTEYSKVFDSVEVDSTFYAIPTDSTVEGWFERAPEDFVFSLKMPRDITHYRR